MPRLDGGQHLQQACQYGGYDHRVCSSEPGNKIIPDVFLDGSWSVPIFAVTRSIKDCPLNTQCSSSQHNGI